MPLRTLRSLVVLFALALAANLAWNIATTDLRAEVFAGGRYVGGVGRWGFGRGWGWGGYGGYGYTSPYQEASYMVQAAGQYNEATSRALINQAEAQKKYIENEREWNQFRNDRREAYLTRKQAENEKERESVNHYLATRKSKLPPRLTPAQLDGYSGVIHWPDALLRKEFEMHRATLNGLFVSRSQTGSTPDSSAAIRAAARAFQDDFRTHINDYTSNPNEYLAARKFLESLALEGDYPLE